MIIRRGNEGTVYGRIMYPLERARVFVAPAIEKRIEVVSAELQVELDTARFDVTRLRSELAAAREALESITQITQSINVYEIARQALARQDKEPINE